MVMVTMTMMPVAMVTVTMVMMVIKVNMGLKSASSPITSSTYDLERGGGGIIKMTSSNYHGYTGTRHQSHDLPVLVLDTCDSGSCPFPCSRGRI